MYMYKFVEDYMYYKLFKYSLKYVYRYNVHIRHMLTIMAMHLLDSRNAFACNFACLRV